MPLNPFRARPTLLTVALACATVAALRAQDEHPPPERADQEEQATDATEADSARTFDTLAPAESRRRPQPGDQVRLYYEDGRRLEGTYITADDDGVTLEISRVRITIPRADMLSVVVLDPPMTRFLRLRALLDENDFDRRVGLAEWAAAQGLLKMALAEIDAVLEAQPMHPDAVRARSAIHSLIQIEESRADRSDEIEQREPTAPPRRPGVDDFPLLSADEVNLLKIYEINLAERPRIIIKRETIDKLLARYADNPLIPTTREGRRALYRKSPTAILDLMFRVRARELYREVTVLDQPESMKFFRDKIHAGWLINSCATTRCHGGTDAGALILTNRRPTAETSVYTNFLIIDRFRTTDDRPLVNYEEPGLSPLIHFGLPREDALTPHPRVRGWNPVFRTREDTGIRNTIDWIGMMYRPRPDYPIEYTSPGELLTREREATQAEPPVER